MASRRTATSSADPSRPRRGRHCATKAASILVSSPSLSRSAAAVLCRLPPLVPPVSTPTFRLAMLFRDEGGGFPTRPKDPVGPAPGQSPWDPYDGPLAADIGSALAAAMRIASLPAPPGGDPPSPADAKELLALRCWNPSATPAAASDSGHRQGAAAAASAFAIAAASARVGGRRRKGMAARRKTGGRPAGWGSRQACERITACK